MWQYGYEVTFLYSTDTKHTTQRMAGVGDGLCAPTHVSLQVRPTGIEADLSEYANASYSAGGTGYSGR